VLVDLRGDRGHPDEDDADRGQRRPEQERAAHRDALEAERTKAEPDQQAEDEVRPGQDGDRGDGVRVASHDRGTDQLGPPGLLLGAGVPDHQQEAHERDEDRRPGHELLRDHRAEGVVVQPEPRSGERPQAGVLHQLGSGLPLGGIRVVRGQAPREQHDRAGDRDDPDREPDAVAAEDEPDQRRRAGQRALTLGGGRARALGGDRRAHRSSAASTYSSP
jgi:hypothetical protein